MNAPRKNRVDVHGWIVLDKPVGMTSTHAVAAVRRLLNAKKAGHAGTLDPLASGILPLAFGEATKTVPYVVDGEKAYTLHREVGRSRPTPTTPRAARSRRATVAPGRGRHRGRAAPLHRHRSCRCRRAIPPSRSTASAPTTSRATARPWSSTPAPSRSTRCASSPTTPIRATFEAECGKGTYVRAIARDLGRTLGCLGHVTALRRTRVGPFTLDDAIDLDGARRRAGSRARGRCSPSRAA